MTRSDFWCRVLGALQMIAGVLTAAAVLLLWQFIRDIFQIEDVTVFSFIVWAIVLLMALPAFLAGLLTFLFANAVERSLEGLKGQSRPVLRVVMALCGLWSAGVIGFAGLSMPPVALLSLLSLVTTGLAIMGPDWTADLMAKPEPKT